MLGLGGFAFEAVFDDGKEGGFDEFGDELGRGVVAAGGLALVASSGLLIEGEAAVGGEHGALFEEAFVDAAEGVDLEVSEVDAVDGCRPALPAFEDGEQVEGAEEGCVGKRRVFEEPEAVVVEELSAVWMDRLFEEGAAFADDPERDFEAFPEVFAFGSVAAGVFGHGA